MSTLKVTNLQHPSAASANVTLDASGNADFNGKNLAGVASVNGGQLGGNRNMLYNGAHTVAQRATQATGVTSSGFYTTDRWEYNTTGEETVTLDQSTDAPDGFSNSYKVTVTTADSSVDSSDYARILQELEGQDTQNLAFGTSSAKSSTLSFWVKSSVTGTYAILFQNTDAARMLTKTYTINSANTWEYKTLTFVGDTAGAVTSDNTVGLRFYFWLTAGSDYTTTDNGDVWTANAATAYAYGQTADVIGTASATWQFTGVQWEVGDTATSYQHESYGTTLQKCLRYYYKRVSDQASGTLRHDIGILDSATAAIFTIHYPVVMRAVPSLSTSGTFTLESTSSSTVTSFSTYSAGPQVYALGATSGSVGTKGYAVALRTASTSAYIEFDAEL